MGLVLSRQQALIFFQSLFLFSLVHPYKANTLAYFRLREYTSVSCSPMQLPLYPVTVGLLFYNAKEWLVK